MKSASLLSASKLAPALFFFIYLLVGLLAYDDYGLSWDELINRRNGAISAIYINARLNHIFLRPEDIAARLESARQDEYLYVEDSPARPRIDYGDTALQTYVDRDYGVFFELSLTALEALLNLRDSRDVYLMRHLVTFLLFYLAVVFFYLLIKNRFDSWIAGLLGAGFLVLSPRIFADSFYNSKDLAFLSLFIIATYSLNEFLERKSTPSALFHAVTSAALIDIRVPGVVIPVVTFLFLAVDVLRSGSPGARLAGAFRGILTYVASLPVLTILFWPYLWERPVWNFLTAFANMTRFRFDGEVLYLGNYYNAANLPWHYAPVWMAITTPILYLACFLVGVYYVLRLLGERGLRLYADEKERRDLIDFVLFFLPLAAVIVPKAVLYDGWRQLFFVYPAFLSIALKGLIFSWRWIESSSQGRARWFLRASLVAVSIASLMDTAYFMIRYHPHQQVYFNVLAGGDVGRKFELDYWGLSYRQALEYILRTDSSRIVKVHAANFPGKLNARILDPQDRERLRYVPIEDATYFLGDFRHYRWGHSFEKPIHSIVVGRATILAVYKLR